MVSLLLFTAAELPAQFRPQQGRSLGTVTTQGKLIVLTLDDGALGTANLFDLSHRTLRFTPVGSRYRVENLPLRWDADFGAAMPGRAATLTKFAFPFSGSRRRSLSVGVTGSLTFSDSADTGRVASQSAGDNRNRGGGLAVDRFAELAEAAPELINTVPAIAVFFKPRLYGTRYLKELADRAVITWSLTEPVGGIQDMSWTPTVNRFQAVLHKDGTIELSYDDVHAQDAIVGVYPVVTGAARTLTSVTDAPDAATPPHLDIRRVQLSTVEGVFLQASIVTAGPVLPEGDAGVAGVSYRVCISATRPTGDCTPDAPGLTWSVFGVRARGARGAAASTRYIANGPGILPVVTVQGNSITVRGTLPSSYAAGNEIFVSVATHGTGAQSVATDQLPPIAVRDAGLRSPALDFTSVKKQDGPYAVAYESFHYLKPPRATDLTCTVIKALGDKFDFLAYYSDFRIDNPEAGTSSNGPLGGGPAGGAVTGIGAEQRNLAGYCSQGRFQWQFIQPVYVGANQMAEYPPDGITETNTHNVMAYAHQLAERTSNGRIPPYDYALSQIAHEMGHRWAAFVSARVNGDTIPLGPTHWARGLQAPVAFPYQRPTEASAMGGGVWQDNYDGTFTQLDDDYYVPATGWSYLDLYLMGFIAPSEVPDFFILRNLAPAGRDTNGHPIVRAERTKLTIQDVIAAEGPRLPDVDHAQKNFNTGMVVVVEHGHTPSAALLEKTNGIRLRWMDYWTTTTGHRSTMTADP